MLFLIDTLLSENPTTAEWTFLVCALLGSVFFVFKGLMMLVSGGVDGLDFGCDVDVDGVDVGDIEDMHGGGAEFTLFSITSLSAFFMMFGWSGLSAHVQFALSPMASTFVALMVGFFVMWATAYLLFAMRKLQSGGANFHIEKAVGKTAKVYQRIPANGQGVIQVSVDGMLHELNAESRSKADIESFTMVEITDSTGANCVIVEPVVEQ